MSENTEVIVEEVVVPEIDPKIEREARSFGWVPQEDFKGAPEQWRSAEEFLDFGKKVNGFLRKDMEKLRNALATKDSELAEIRATVQQFSEYHKKTEEQAYQRALKALRQERNVAIREGEDERAAQIEAEIEDFQKQSQEVKAVVTAPVKPQEQPADPSFIEWIKENQWYKTDKVAAATATGIAEDMRNEGSTLVGMEFLEEVRRRTMEEIPHRFKTARERAPAVEGNTNTNRPVPQAKGKKTYNSLPYEAQAACDRFVKQGLMTQEQYVTEYFQN